MREVFYAIECHINNISLILLCVLFWIVFAFSFHFALRAILPNISAEIKRLWNPTKKKSKSRHQILDDKQISTTVHNTFATKNSTNTTMCYSILFIVPSIDIFSDILRIKLDLQKLKNKCANSRIESLKVIS